MRPIERAPGAARPSPSPVERWGASAHPEAQLASIVLDAVERLRPPDALAPPSAGLTAGPLDTPDERRMTALLVYAYSLGVVSSRVIEGATATDSVAVFLAGRRRSHAEVRAFRRAHRVALVNVFVDVYRSCQAEGLARLGHVALETARLAIPGDDPTAGAAEPVPRTATALAHEADRLLSQSEQEDREDDLLFGVSRREVSVPSDLGHHTSSGARLHAVLKALSTEPLTRS